MAKKVMKKYQGKTGSSTVMQDYLKNNKGATPADTARYAGPPYNGEMDYVTKVIADRPKNAAALEYAYRTKQIPPAQLKKDVKPVQKPMLAQKKGGTIKKKK
jgi:hypothetical protein